MRSLAMRPLVPRRAVVVGVIGAAVLAGCSSPATAPTAPPPPPAAAQPPSPAAQPSSSSRAAGTPAEPVLAAATVPLARDIGDGTLTFSVLELTVRGQLTQLRLRLQTEGDAGDDLRVIRLMGTGDAARALAPELIDPVNLKAYSEVDGGVGLADAGNASLAAGWADFTFSYAAPQDAVSTLDVAIGSGFPTLRDVPLAR